MNVQDKVDEPAKSRRIELVAVAAFVVVNLLAPLVVGEMYPFTISPMFRDQPKEYCTYQLFDESGVEIDPETFGLHLVYDGNPPGLGMGIEATPRMHEFGVVPTVETVVDHVRNVAKTSGSKRKRIRLCQSIVSCPQNTPETIVREAMIRLEPEGQVPE